MYDIIVIGGGIVGLSSAYKINKRFPHLKIAVLEKESEVGQHQTGRNSGVIHSGLYYKPGSYKAKNCVTGRRELVEFAKKYKVPHEVCGKIVVATKTTEIPFLEKIFSNGIANEVEGIEFIDSAQIKEIEPHCVGVRGIWVPCTGIISFKSVTKKLQELIQQSFTQSEVLTGLKVKKIVKHNDYNEIITDKNSIKCKYIVNCAGLYSDKIAELDGLKRTSRIVGFRGDYYDLTEKGKEKVKNLIYPVPNPAFPFLGVHFTRMVDGTIECGPNAVFVFKREGYGKTDFHFGETMDALSYKGTWKLFMKHWQFGLDEYKRAFSKKMFLNRLKGLIPDLQADDIKPGRSGVRAMALGPDGAMIDDFEIRYNHNSLHVLNAPSPAATSGLAIGEEVANLAQKKFSLV
ncbi:MAG: L-2-hydroxyglutarate oxidase [Chitinophagaceae bacterium]|nr:MAG: L-2-hydroxyglutarate oxidase [Chitinophagaceae bacterium]